MLHDASVQEAEEIVAGTRPPLLHFAAVDAAAVEAAQSTLKGRLLRGVKRLAAGGERVHSRRLSLVRRHAAKAAANEDGDDKVLCRTMLLATLLDFCRTSGDVALPPLRWERPDDTELAALAERAPDATLHSSGVRCDELPQLIDRAMLQLSFLFAAYRIDRWYWEVAELLRKLALTSILALIAPGSARAKWWWACSWRSWGC